MNDIVERSQTHATFVIERDYTAPLDRRLARALGQRRSRSLVRRRADVRRRTRSRMTSASADERLEDG